MNETWQRDKGLQEDSERQMVEVLNMMSEDREALKWVREHGGLGCVKMAWLCMTELDKYQLEVASKLGLFCEGLDAQDTQERIMDEIDKLQIYQGILQYVCSIVTGKSEGRIVSEDLYDELRKRLMPKGMKWPCYEDGKPVKFGDELPEFSGTIYKNVRSFYFVENGNCSISNNGGSANVDVVVYKGENVKRPLPIGNDGEPIELFQNVYGMSDGKQWYVIGFNYDIKHCVTAIDGDGVVRDLKPEWITHEKSAFGADGMPFWKGQKVYDVETGDEHIVYYISDDGQYFYPTDFYAPDLIKCSSVTSTKPEPVDTWAMIWTSVTTGAICLEEFERRCKALADKENN